MTLGISVAQETVERAVGMLQRRVPGLLAVYGFGSRIQGTACADSDLDMAVLVAGYADVLLLWQLSGELADIAGCAVDLLDLQPHSPAMGQKDGEKWTAAADLQPTISKSDSLLDMGQHLIRRERLGVPQSARDVFALLAQGGWIAPALADGLKRMVGFRNIAVHDYKALQLPITVAIIEKHLDEFLQYSQAVLLGRPNA